MALSTWIMTFILIVLFGGIFYLAYEEGNRREHLIETVGPQLTCPEGQVLVSAHGMRSALCLVGSEPKQNW